MTFHMVVQPRIAHPVPFRLLLCDADGTLRRCTVPHQPCPNRDGEWELLPHVRLILAQYDWDLTRLGIVSNQGGVGLGYLSYEMAAQLLDDLREAACPQAMALIRLCPHRPGQGCLCRKPSPLMLLDIMCEYEVTLAQALYVGDRPEDLEAAQRAGIAFAWAWDFFGRDA